MSVLDHTEVEKTYDQLAIVRKELVDLRLEKARKEATLKVEKAAIEAQITEIRGGDKNLGPNEDARKRALTVALAEHTVYTELIRGLFTVDAVLARTEAQLENLKDQTRLYRLLVDDAKVGDG